MGIFFTAKVEGEEVSIEVVDFDAFFHSGPEENMIVVDEAGKAKLVPKKNISDLKMVHF